MCFSVLGVVLCGSLVTVSYTTGYFISWCIRKCVWMCEYNIHNILIESGLSDGHHKSTTTRTSVCTLYSVYNNMLYTDVCVSMTCYILWQKYCKFQGLPPPTHMPCRCKRYFIIKYTRRLIPNICRLHLANCNYLKNTHTFRITSVGVDLKKSPEVDERFIS